MASREEIVVLVEGRSDQAAIETLAGRLGRDLARENVVVVALGGATNVGAFVRGRDGGGHVLGLCDAGEARVFEQAGIEYFVCVNDLEDELIRALGVDAVIRIVEGEGHLRSFRTMQKQPAHRGRPVDGQLHRFFGSHSGFKIRYARLLVDALDLDQLPPPLAGLFAVLPPSEEPSV